MGLSSVIFQRTEGALGRKPANNDDISGLVFYHDTLPSGFTSNDRVKAVFNIQDAEALGIVNTHTDETKATGGQVQITVAGGAGEVVGITLDTAVLGNYTIVAGDTANDIATGLRAAINALTTDHGFVAAGSTDTVTLTAPSKLGQSINTSKAVLAFSDGGGTSTATVTQFSNGVGSILALMHYHISEFFRMNSKGRLYVGIFAEGTYDASELVTMQQKANGNIRQMGIYLNDDSFATSLLTATQTYCTTLRTNHQPISAIVAADFFGATLSAVTDLTTLTSSDVSATIGEDGNFLQADYSNTKSYVKGDKVNWAGKIYQAKLNSLGYPPFNSTYWSEIAINLRDVNGFTVSTIGNTLGSVSLAKVHENIGWVEKFVINSGNTLDVAGFATGDLYETQATSLLDTINDRHYIFPRKFIGRSDTFYNDGYTAIANTSDYATIENNRVMDKAERLVYTAMVAKLNSPLYVNTDGTLSESTVAVFENVARSAVEQMEIDGEVSGLVIDIDPEQDVLGTSKIVVSVKLVPVGVARTIEINSGFTILTS